MAQQIIHEQNHCPCGPHVLPGWGSPTPMCARARVRVRVYARVGVRVCVRTCVCVGVCVRVRIRVRARIRACTRVGVCVWARAHTCVVMGL